MSAPLIRDENHVPALTDEDYPRFWSRVSRGASADGCWLWTGATTHNGYGFFFMRKPAAKHYRAHRITWTMENGQIPTGFDIDHRCLNHRCVNPSHLEMVTTEVNTWRRDGRHWQALMSPLVLRAALTPGDIDGNTFTTAAVQELLGMSPTRVKEACLRGELRAEKGVGIHHRRGADQWHIRRTDLIDFIIHRAAEDAGVSVVRALSEGKAA